VVAEMDTACRIQIIRHIVCSKQELPVLDRRYTGLRVERERERERERELILSNELVILNQIVVDMRASRREKIESRSLKKFDLVEGTCGVRTAERVRNSISLRTSSFVGT
jgi:hypothetical protein